MIFSYRPALHLAPATGRTFGLWVFHLLVNRNANYFVPSDQKGTYASLPFSRSMIWSNWIGSTRNICVMYTKINLVLNVLREIMNWSSWWRNREESGSKVIYKMNFLFVLSSTLTHIPNIPNKIFDFHSSTLLQTIELIIIVLFRSFKLFLNKKGWIRRNHDRYL